MPLTLAEAKALSQDKLTGLVIDEFRKSGLLDMLPFDNTVLPQGDGQTLAYVYNRVTTQPTAAPRAINSDYTPQETKTEQITVNLKVFGGSYNLDRVIIQHERLRINHIQMQSEQKVKATRALFHDMAINGDSGVNATQFDGIDKAVAGGVTEIIPSAAIDLSSSSAIDSNWKTFLDALRDLEALLDGSPTLWLMNKGLYAKFQSVMDRAGINLTSKANYGTEATQWGSALVMSLGDKPGSSNPIIPTTNGETSIYPIRLGLDGVHGVSPEGDKLVEVYLPDMKSSDAVKTGAVEMVAAMAIKNSKSAGVLRKIKIV